MACVYCIVYGQKPISKGFRYCSGLYFAHKEYVCGSTVHREQVYIDIHHITAKK